MEMVEKLISQEMLWVAIGAGAVIGIFSVMLFYSLVFEILLPLAKRVFGIRKETSAPEEVEVREEQEEKQEVVQDEREDEREEDKTLEALADIERQMLSLRDLFRTGDISPELYLKKSQALADEAERII